VNKSFVHRIPKTPPFHHLLKNMFLGDNRLLLEKMEKWLQMEKIALLLF